jgi:hypothetical protein
VKTLRASSYTLQVSANHRTWRTVARVRGVTRRSTDVLRSAPVRARWLRIVITKGGLKPIKPTKQNQNPPPTTPILEELTATR